MIEKLTKMLESVPKNLDLEHYVFIASIDLKCDINIFNGFKVYYDKRLKGDKIVFRPSPYAKDYNL